jgi:hypothetical protein
MLELEIVCNEGFVLIRADQLASVTADDLRKFGMSREQLQKLFAEGARLMQGKTAADRVRPCAAQTMDGTWKVGLVRYSAVTDPPLDSSAKGKA